MGRWGCAAALRAWRQRNQPPMPARFAKLAPAAMPPRPRRGLSRHVAVPTDRQAARHSTGIAQARLQLQWAQRARHPKQPPPRLQVCDHKGQLLQLLQLLQLPLLRISHLWWAGHSQRAAQDTELRRRESSSGQGRPVARPGQRIAGRGVGIVRRVRRSTATQHLQAAWLGARCAAPAPSLRLAVGLGPGPTCCTRFCMRYLKFFICPRMRLRAAWCRRMLQGRRGWHATGHCVSAQGIASRHADGSTAGRAVPRATATPARPASVRHQAGTEQAGQAGRKALGRLGRQVRQAGRGAHLSRMSQ